MPSVLVSFCCNYHEFSIFLFWRSVVQNGSRGTKIKVWAGQTPPGVSWGALSLCLSHPQWVVRDPLRQPWGHPDTPGLTLTFTQSHLQRSFAARRGHVRTGSLGAGTRLPCPLFIPQQPRCSFLGGTSLPVTALPCLPPSSSSEQSSGQSHSPPLADSPVGVACPAPTLHLPPQAVAAAAPLTPSSVLAGTQRSPWPPHHVALLTYSHVYYHAELPMCLFTCSLHRQTVRP